MSGEGESQKGCWGRGGTPVLGMTKLRSTNQADMAVSAVGAAVANSRQGDTVGKDTCRFRGSSF